jgi:conjugal transfer pilus assembly protein TraA
MFKNEVKKAWTYLLFALAITVIVALPEWAQAASTSGPLTQVYTDMSSWVQGNVGKTTALAMIMVGLVAGIARQSLMAFAVGIGGGLGLYNAPTIIDTVFNATLYQ